MIGPQEDEFCLIEGCTEEAGCVFVEAEPEDQHPGMCCDHFDFGIEYEFGED